MHVKYASRHALYPVPNACVVFDVAARAVDTRALRDTLVAVRATLLLALRAVVIVARFDVARDVKEFCAPARAFVLVVRATTPDVVRAFDDFFVLVRFVGFCASVCVLFRDMLFCVRTAASAPYRPMQRTAAKSKIFFILCV